MTILVTGASGTTGRAVVGALTRRGARIRAMTSQQAAERALLEAGAAETAWARFDDVASLASAMEGVDTVLHIPPRMKPDETRNGCNVIAAAKAAGVRVIALHSVVTSQVQAIRFHTHKRLVEEAAMTSGLPWIVFQPTNYMQNVAWNWDRIVRDGEFLFPYSADRLVSWLDLDDYAEAVAVALTTPGYEYGVYEAVSTRRPLTRQDMAAIWSRVLGRPVRATTMTLDDYMRLPHWSGRDPAEMAILRTMFEEFDRHGAPGGNWHVLGMLLGREPTGYEAFAERFAASRHPLGSTRPIDARS